MTFAIRTLELSQFSFELQRVEYNANQVSIVKFRSNLCVKLSCTCPKSLNVILQTKVPFPSHCNLKLRRHTALLRFNPKKSLHWGFHQSQVTVWSIKCLFASCNLHYIDIKLYEVVHSLWWRRWCLESFRSLFAFSLCHTQVIIQPIANPVATAPAISTCCFSIAMVTMDFLGIWDWECCWALRGVFSSEGAAVPGEVADSLQIGRLGRVTSIPELSICSCVE